LAQEKKDGKTKNTVVEKGGPERSRGQKGGPHTFEGGEGGGGKGKGSAKKKGPLANENFYFWGRRQKDV